MNRAKELEQWYEEHSTALYAFLLNLTRNETDTRDLLQEVFVRLAQRPDRLDGVQSPRAYLLRLAYNLAVDVHRRRGTRERFQSKLAQDDPAPFAPAPDPDEAAFQRAILQALETLPTAQRAVLHLKLWEGLTFQEIARLLDIPPDTAASRYRYGLDKMREHLRPLYSEIR